jgi:Cupin domain
MIRQNLFSDAWDGDNEEGGTRHRIFWRPDDARMGATLYELAPGAPEMRMHMHFGAEEMFFVLSGRPVFRNQHGEEEMAPGDFVFCPRIGFGWAGRLAPVHHADDRCHPHSPMRAQGSRSLTKVVDLSLASAGALRVRCHLERIQLNHVVADLTLHLHATSGLEAFAHDSGNILEPPAHMRLESRRLKVGERTVNPVLNRRDAEHPVEVGVALQSVVRLKLCELSLSTGRAICASNGSTILRAFSSSTSRRAATFVVRLARSLSTCSADED